MFINSGFGATAMAMGGKFDKTQAECIGDLLNSPSIPMQQFAVPRFQRNYSWGQVETDKLWTDAYNNYIEHEEDSAANFFASQYMLGPMVLLEDRGPNYVWQVIDGQQRLATLTTLFCVIRDIFFVLKDQHGDDEGYRLIKKLIERKTFSSMREPRLMLNHTDKGMFFDVIQTEGNPDEKIMCWHNDIKGQKKSVPKSHKLLMKCYEDYYEKISNVILVGFVKSEDMSHKLEAYRDKQKKNITEDMIKDPNTYSLPTEFFERHWDGSSFVYDNKVSENEKQDYDALKGKPSGKKFQNIDDYMRYKIRQKQKKFDKVVSKIVKGKKSTMLKTADPANITTLTKFLEHVVRQNFVVTVKVRDENDAFMIFETLNERGKPLSKSELVKNMCFGVIKKESDITELDTRWIEIFNAELKNGDRFIRESLRSRYFDMHVDKGTGKVIKASTAHLFKIIKEIIGQDESKVREYVDWLETDSKFVKCMDFPALYADNKSIGYNLFAVERLDAISIRVPMLTAYRRWNSGDEFAKFSDLLIKFHFRNRTVGQRHPSEMEDDMLSVARMVDNGQSLTNIIEYLRKKDAGDEEFEGDFYRFRVGDSEVIKYVLLEIERYLRGDQAIIQLNSEATVEHILPKNAKEYWNKEDFFSGWDLEKDRDFDLHYDRIGNMTLLSKGLNSKIKNKSFCVKKTEAYVNEKFLQITRETVLKMAKCAEELGPDFKPELEDVKEWTALTIDERSKCFAKLARIIWDI